MGFLTFLLYFVPILCIAVTIFVIVEAVKYFNSLRSVESSSKTEQT